MYLQDVLCFLERKVPGSLDQGVVFTAQVSASVQTSLIQFHPHTFRWIVSGQTDSSEDAFDCIGIFHPQESVG